MYSACVTLQIQPDFQTIHENEQLNLYTMPEMMNFHLMSGTDPYAECLKRDMQKSPYLKIK